MKNKLYLILSVTVFLFSNFSFAQDRSSATVTSQDGIYIFMCCKPTLEYEHLGTLNQIVICPSPKTIDTYIQKVKSQYPKANGIMFSSVNLVAADIIYIKEKVESKNNNNNS